MRKTTLWCVRLLAFMFSANAAASDHTRESSPPEVIAHRGASHVAPENTLAAFKEAWKRGADGIEADFRLSADGKVVCIHDKTTKRCGDQNLDVSKSTLEQLQSVDVGSWKGQQYQGERMPTLDKVLAIVPKGKRILIELKGDRSMVKPTRQAIFASDLNESQIVMISFNASVIAECRKTMPNLKANLLVTSKIKDGHALPSASDLVGKMKKANATGVGIKASRNVLTDSYMAILREAEFEIHCWTINEPDEALYYLDIGIDSITTDKPGVIREAVDRSLEK